VPRRLVALSGALNTSIQQNKIYNQRMTLKESTMLQFKLLGSTGVKRNLILLIMKKKRVSSIIGRITVRSSTSAQDLCSVQCKVESRGTSIIRHSTDSETVVSGP